MNEPFQQALHLVLLSPGIYLIVFAAAMYGVFVGAIPGLTATMAVALFVPIAYWLDPVPALAAIVTMVACAIFAGDLPTTLLRIPGTPASAAYADDAYAFTRRGQSERVLGVALVCSTLGGLLGAVVLMLLGHQLAKVATQFSVAEYFWLYLLGLSCSVVVSRGSTLRAILALMIGLLLATVGLSAVHARARFTFGQPELFQGISFIPAMIGLFGLSEVLNNLVTRQGVSGSSGQIEEQDPQHPPEPAGWFQHRIMRPISSVIGPGAALFWRRKPHTLRSSALGSLIGMLPGAGADIAAWVSLAASKRFSKKTGPDEEQSLNGIGDATTANSSALAGTWIPALVFGIPGDSVTAIVIGVLMMKNVRPGPEIFEKQAALVYSIYIIFILANIALIGVGLLAIKTGSLVVRLPKRVLLPIILLFCVMGAYAMNGSYFDVGIMLAMGLLGFALERRRVPLGPVVLGLILGGPLEERFIQTITRADGSLLAFFDRPIAAALGMICLALWLSVPVRQVFQRQAISKHAP